MNVPKCHFRVESKWKIVYNNCRNASWGTNILRGSYDEVKKYIDILA